MDAGAPALENNYGPLMGEEEGGGGGVEGPQEGIVNLKELCVYAQIFNNKHNFSSIWIYVSNIPEFSEFLQWLPPHPLPHHCWRWYNKNCTSSPPLSPRESQIGCWCSPPKPPCWQDPYHPIWRWPACLPACLPPRLRERYLAEHKLVGEIYVCPNSKFQSQPVSYPRL